MKKIFLIVGLAAMSCATNVFAQRSDDETEAKYIRNSMYMMKLDMPTENPDYQEAFNIMNSTFGKMDFAKRYDRYNDFSLSNRIIKLTDLPEATEAEMDLIDNPSAVEEAITKFINQALEEQGIKPGRPEREYAARLLNYFKQEKTANKLVAKWFNTKDTPEGQFKHDPDEVTVYEYGVKAMSSAAKQSTNKDDMINKAAGLDAITKLLSNTYVCVNRYGYMDAKEVVIYATAAATVAMAKLPAIAQAAAQKGIDKIAANIKGYFVRANAYLFKLDWSKDLTDKLESDYGPKPNMSDDEAAAISEKFMNDPAFKLSYVGKSSKRAPAALSLKASTNYNALVERATLRGTDAALAALQRDYEEFRPMVKLLEIDGKLAAYIGMKEGIKAGDKFDVFEKTEDENGIIEWKPVGSIKVGKGNVWDNREGAGQTIEGEAPEEGEQEAAASVEYTVFDGKPSKKIHEGCMIRLAKK